VFFFAILAAGLGQWSPAQTPAPAPRQLGTVKAIAGNTITVAPDSGQPVTVTLSDAVKVVQLPAGSTDLKTATPAAVSDIAVGDRILASGKPGDAAGPLTAVRVVLMKSGDIAKRRAQEQADWQRRGSGGLVTAVDPASATLTVTAGAKKIQIKTAPTTVFRRYSGDSIKFEDAVPGTLAQIQAGDQLRVRGAKSDDGLSIQAEEIISGSFANLSGVIATLDASSGSITLKDLATKKNMTIKVTANSDLRNLPERAAAMFAARAKGGAAGAAAPAADSAGGGAAAPQRGPGGPGGGPGGGGGRSAGMDLSQMLSRLPTQALADLKVGEAVMIVASVPAPGSTKVTAITLLTGVEPILAASPAGTTPELSPWNMSEGPPDAGGGQ
jgi:hypothetical protein